MNSLIILVGLLVFPIIWPIVARMIWRKQITWQEMCINIGLVVLIVLIGFGCAMAGKTTDTEVLNGAITGKESVRVHCEHSYDCNCYYTTDRKGNMHRHCMTCYEHAYDVDWNVYTSINSGFRVGRVDSQGLTMPPRWGLFAVGQPYSTTEYYTNYIKAAPDSLFNKEGFTSLKEKFAKMIPAYPDNTYDYQYIDRVLDVGVGVPNIKQWDYDLGLALRDIGPKKQGNVVIVFANTADPNYANALNAAWLGGKKNDIVVVLGVTKWPHIDWTGVFSWSNSELMKVEIRDDIDNLNNVNESAVLNIIHTRVMAEYQRRHMSDFSYLRAEIVPSDGAIWFLLAISVLGSLLLSWYFEKNDPFGGLNNDYY